MYIPDRRLMVGLLVAGLFVVLAFGWFWSPVMVHAPSSRLFTVAVVGNPQEMKDLCLDGSMERAKFLPLSTVYESPVHYDDTRGLRPLLLTDWRYSPDGKSLELDLKRRVLFHNGKEMTAQDIKLCWEKTLRQAASEDVVLLFSPVAGTDRFINGQATDIQGLQVVNNHTLKIVLTRPDAFFVSVLANPAFWVYDSSDRGKAPAGTGPYQLQEIKDNRISVKAYAHYHGETPRLGRIDFLVYSDGAAAIKDYQTGKVNLVDEIEPDELKELQKDQKVSRLLVREPLFAFYGCAFNCKNDPWCDNYLLRRAINYAIDRRAVVRDIFAGAASPIRGPLLPGLSGYLNDTRGYEYNPELAKQLLSDAGYPQGQDLSPVTLYYLSNDGYGELASSIKEQLATLGIEVTLQAMNYSALASELRAMRQPWYLMGWQADYPEGYSFLASLYGGESGYNGYYNPQVNKLLQEAAAQVRDHRKREEILRQAARLITEDSPMLWICQRQTVKLIGPGVEGLDINGLNQVNWLQLGFKEGS